MENVNYDGLVIDKEEELDLYNEEIWIDDKKIKHKFWRKKLKIKKKN
jgi:hypothetical protein